jgi:hypothetical protein
MVYAGFVPVAGGTWKPGQHPPIIDKALAERIEAMRLKRKITTPGRLAMHPYPLSRILYCQYCGGKLLGAGPINRKYYFRH